MSLKSKLTAVNNSFLSNMSGWCSSHCNPIVAFGSVATGSNPILWIHAVARCLHMKINEILINSNRILGGVSVVLYVHQCFVQ